ncbi:CPBP family intramembrane metalloprotease [Clostridium botulinum]|nr:CPBP family intramembrane metalloprotease [Clostridium botulinum]
MNNPKPYPNIIDSIKLLTVMLIIFYFSYIIINFIGNYCNVCLDRNPYANIFMILVSEGFVIFYAYKKSSTAYLNPSVLKKISPFLLISIAISVVGIDIILSECDNLLNIFLANNIILDTAAEDMFNQNNIIIASIISTSIISPILEELLFRGIILKGFLKNYNTLTAIFMSSLFFSLLHRDIGQAFGAFIFGIFFAFIYIKTNSLLSNIFAHFLSNSLHHIITYALKIKINGYNLNTTLIQHQPFWFNILGIVLTIIGMFLLFRAFTSPDSKNKKQQIIKI